jgi:hypothetical protein
MESKVIGPSFFFFEEPTVTGDTFMTMMDRPQFSFMFLWEQFSSQMVNNFASPIVFLPFWTGSFLIVGSEAGTHSLAPTFSRFFTLQDLFFWGFVIETVYREKV